MLVKKILCGRFLGHHGQKMVTFSGVVTMPKSKAPQGFCRFLGQMVITLLSFMNIIIYMVEWESVAPVP